MKKYKAVKRQIVSAFICDGCGLESSIDEGFEFSEFITIEHRCGYGAIHGDGKELSVDFCQHCFAGMCGDVLTVTDPVDNQSTDSPEESLEYNTIFQTISPSKQETNEIKQQSDTRTSVRDIVFSNTISNQEELQIALKRVEQLWDSQCHSAEGSELHKLADLIFAYENKSWDSYFAETELADDDFMSDRLNTIEGLPLQKLGVASIILTDTHVNKDIDEDDSSQSTTDEKDIAEVSVNVIGELLMLHNEILEFFGSKVDVDTWIHTELPVLYGEKPISLLSTIQGRKTLKQVLNRMKHGDV
jgi:antitoxin CcdA